MSTLPRVFVDDTDTDLIQYTGPWFASTTAQFNAFGNNGTPFMGTLHGTTSNASFSFTFNGTSIAFYGTFNETQPSSALGLAPAPTVQCVVLLSHEASVTGLNPHLGNNMQFCNQLPPLKDGQHTVVVDVAFPQTNDPSLIPQPFWFDKILYEASPSSSLNNSRVMIFPPDSRMHFGDGWTPAYSEASPQEIYGNKTNIKNSTFTIEFYGESLLWYSILNHSVATTETTASYTVDSGPPTIFDIPSSIPIESGQNALEFNMLLFQTPTNQNGPHILTVMYNGNAAFNTSPLSLDYVVVNNRTSTTIGTNTSSATPSSFSKTQGNIGTIVGGTLGLLFITALFIALLVILLQRRRKALTSGGNCIIDQSLQGFPLPVNPFIVSREDIFAAVGKTTPSTPPADARTSRESRKTRMREALNAPGTTSDQGRAPRADSTQGMTLATTTTAEISPSLIVSRLVSSVCPSTVVRREEDSGIRLSQPNGVEVTLLPPEYTLS